MSGTLLNCITILIGSLIGVRIGDRLPASMRESIMNGLGLVTAVVGMQNAFKTGNILIPLIGLLTGTIIGEFINVDGALKRFGGWLQAKVEKNQPEPAAEAGQRGQSEPSEPSETSTGRARFINGFVTASLVFCVGPLTILGSIENGMNPANMQLLALKSTLDGFAAIAFAATLGIGVAFSILPTIVLQGGLALVGMLLVSAVTGGTMALDGNNIYIRELTSVGGMMIMGISLILLNLKPVKVANFLPGLITTPLIVLVGSVLGVNLYPL